jgi:hypothetical protein
MDSRVPEGNVVLYAVLPGALTLVRKRGRIAEPYRISDIR